MRKNWRHVWGFSGYVISDQGVVMERATGKILAQSQALDGCTTVVLVSNTGLPFVKKVCRLVVDSFDWVSEGYTPIYHLDGDKHNNELDNLRRKSAEAEALTRYAAETSYLAQEDVDKAEGIVEDEPVKPKRVRAPRKLNDLRGVRIIETGEEFESKAALCRAKGLDPSTVSKMLRRVGRNMTHHGYTFEYVDDNSRPHIRIIQTEEVYYNILEMCRALELEPSNVRKMLKPGATQHTYHKMSFELVDRDDPSLENVKILRFYDRPDVLPTKTSRRSRPVRIVQTGQVYDSQLACAKAIGGRQTSISQCLVGERKSHLGWRFEYAD